MKNNKKKENLKVGKQSRPYARTEKKMKDQY